MQLLKWVVAAMKTMVTFSVSGLFLLPTLPLQNPNPSISCSLSPLPTRLPSPSHLIAVGDLHGDLNKTKQALCLAGLINTSDRYIGSSATVVQVGDVLDRGGDELKILYFLEKLKREAGSREFFDGFREESSSTGFEKRVLRWVSSPRRGLRPNDPISSRFLSQNVTILVAGDSIFVHGGLLPQHVDYCLERINEKIRDWIKS